MEYSVQLHVTLLFVCLFAVVVISVAVPVTVLAGDFVVVVIAVAAAITALRLICNT